jgi:hypothetical protein
LLGLLPNFQDVEQRYWKTIFITNPIYFGRQK